MISTSGILFSHRLPQRSAPLMGMVHRSLLRHFPMACLGFLSSVVVISVSAILRLGMEGIFCIWLPSFCLCLETILCFTEIACFFTISKCPSWHISITRSCNFSTITIWVTLVTTSSTTLSSLLGHSSDVVPSLYGYTESVIGSLHLPLSCPDLF